MARGVPLWLLEMVSCVADSHESEEKCFTNKRQESNWYLSEAGLLLATHAAVMALYFIRRFFRNVRKAFCSLLLLGFH